MNTMAKLPKWMLTPKEEYERNRLHDLWATRRITAKQIERKEKLDRKKQKERDILNAIH